MPVALRFGGRTTTTETESQAREHIIEKLRNRDYLTEQTIWDLQFIQAKIDQLQSLLSQEGLNHVIEDATNEIEAANNRSGSNSTTEDASPGSEVAGGDRDIAATATEPVGSAGSESTTDTDSGSESGKLTALQDSDNPQHFQLSATFEAPIGQNQTLSPSHRRKNLN